MRLMLLLAASGSAVARDAADVGQDVFYEQLSSSVRLSRTATLSGES